MRYLSFCSGVEAASIAWMPLGWEAVAFSEIEPFPCAVLKERFPDVPNLGDCTKIHYDKNTEELYVSGTDGIVSRRINTGEIDLCVGGFPCQSFSVAGERTGLKGASGLILDYFRLLKEIKPKWVVYENVPGMFFSEKGRDFGIILDGFRECGYHVAWRVLDAQYVRVDGYPRAVPQRRRRVFVVGHLGGWQYPASVLFEPDCLFGDTPPRRTKRQGLAAGAESGIDSAKSIRMRCGKPGGGKGALIGDNLSHTLATGNDQTIVTWWNGKDRADTLTVTSNNQFMPDKSRLQCVVDMRQIEAQETEVSPALIATDYKGGNAVCFENYGNDSRIKESPGVSPTLTSRAGTGGGNLPLVVRDEEPIICAGFCQGASPSAGSIGYHNQVSPTIKAGESGTAQVPALLCVHGAQDPIVNSDHANAAGVMEIANNATVRRLLPVECERLMGFPDNHTRIPWKGKPESECPDAPRYKACGNSMCVNVMRWIGMRIEMVERKMRHEHGK